MWVAAAVWGRRIEATVRDAAMARGWLCMAAMQSAAGFEQGRVPLFWTATEAGVWRWRKRRGQAVFCSGQRRNRNRISKAGASANVCVGAG